jgi:hypothetical protein
LRMACGRWRGLLRLALGGLVNLLPYEAPRFFSKVALSELRPFTVVLVRFGVAAIAMQLVALPPGISTRRRQPGSRAAGTPA